MSLFGFKGDDEDTERDDPRDCKLSDILSALNALKIDITDIKQRLVTVESGSAGGAVASRAPPVTTNTNNSTPIDPEDPPLDTTNRQSAKPKFGIPAYLVAESPTVLVPKSVEVKQVYDSYQALKDSLSKVRVPEDLLLSDAKFTCKAESKKAIAITRKSGQYIATTSKLLVDLLSQEQVTKDGADLIYLCLKAHINSLTQELQGFVFEGTGVPKEALGTVAVMSKSQNLLDKESVEAFKLSCDIHCAAEKAKSASSSTPNSGAKVKGRQWTSSTKNNQRGYFNQNQNQSKGDYNRPFGGYQRGGQRDAFDNAVSQNSSKP